jgi:hypothetical protein
MLLFPNSIRLNGSAFSGLGEPHKGWLRTWLSQLHADDIHFESTRAAVNEFAFEAFKGILFVY